MKDHVAWIGAIIGAALGLVWSVSFAHHVVTSDVWWGAPFALTIGLAGTVIGFLALGTLAYVLVGGHRD